MARDKVSRTELYKQLILETDFVLGRFALILRGKVVIEPSDGDPNWTARCEALPRAVAQSFAVALKRIQSRYELDEGRPAEVEQVKFFAKKTLDSADWAIVKERIDDLQFALGGEKKFMMFSVESEDPAQRDIYIAVPDIAMLDAFLGSGFTPVAQESLPELLISKFAQDQASGLPYGEASSQLELVGVERVL